MSELKQSKRSFDAQITPSYLVCFYCESIDLQQLDDGENGAEWYKCRKCKVKFSYVRNKDVVKDVDISNL